MSLNDITPHYYNSYTELGKRLKKRMRENRRKFRFRNKDGIPVSRARKTRKISSSESEAGDQHSALSSEDSQSDAEV